MICTIDPTSTRTVAWKRPKAGEAAARREEGAMCRGCRVRSFLHRWQSPLALMRRMGGDESLGGGGNGHDESSDPLSSGTKLATKWQP